MTSLDAYDVVELLTIKQQFRKIHVTKWGDGSLGLSITESNNCSSIYFTPEETSTFTEFFNAHF